MPLFVTLDEERLAIVGFLEFLRKNNFFENWKKAIPRKDRVLEKQDVLCDKHFRDEDVLRFEIVFVNGEEHSLPRKLPKLKDGALPCIWPSKFR